jgi:hypothetical protein
VLRRNRRGADNRTSWTRPLRGRRQTEHPIVGRPPVSSDAEISALLYASVRRPGMSGAVRTGARHDPELRISSRRDGLSGWSTRNRGHARSARALRYTLRPSARPRARR